MTTSAQPKLVRIYCKETGKILCRMNAGDEWPAGLTLWLWCRGHHAEHAVNAEYIQEARTHDVNKIYR